MKYNLNILHVKKSQVARGKLSVKSSPYFYHDQIALIVFFSISSKKCLKHFIMKLLKVKFEIKSKLQVAIIIPPTLSPRGLGRSRTTGHQRGFREIIFLNYWPRQEAKAWPGLPALASPTLMASIHQNSQWKTLPCSRRSTVHRQEPQAAVGHRVGGIITATCSLALISNFTSRSFILQCLRHFLLEILKKTINA